MIKYYQFPHSRQDFTPATLLRGLLAPNFMLGVYFYLIGAPIRYPLYAIRHYRKFPYTLSATR